MPICPISVTLFFTVHSFYEYVQSNQSNARDRKKPLQQEQSFFLQCFSLFLRASVSSLLSKESKLGRMMGAKSSKNWTKIGPKFYQLAQNIMETKITHFLFELLSARELVLFVNDFEC